MPPGPYDLEPTVPSGAESRRLGASRIREMKARLEATFKDGPMSNFPMNVECTPGWSRVLPPYSSDAALLAVPVVAPYYRLASVSPDGGATITSLFVELPTGWKRISGRP
jgi:hypothetical protein